jgi:DNA-binding transcriptional LysR family regulator
MIESGVELREIRTFLVLAEELHFGRTAERLLVTPSRVSQTIRTLETRVGGRLFERTSRSVRLTAVGEQLRAAATQPYLELQQAVRASQDAVAAITGTLRIGMYTESLGGRYLVSIVTSFEASHPGANVALASLGLQRNYLDVLRAGEVDMIATRLPISDPDITVGPILTHEERVLLVATGDPLAKQGSVTLEDFADRAVSDAPALPREMMDALIPPVTPSNRRYRRHESPNIEEMLMSIAAGKQVHPTVPSFLEHHAHPAVTSVPISDLPTSETALVWLTANRAPKIAAFARVAASVLAGTEPS